MTSSPTTATLKCSSIVRMYPATLDYQLWTQKLKISALGLCFTIINEKKNGPCIAKSYVLGHTAGSLVQQEKGTPHFSRLGFESVQLK